MVNGVNGGSVLRFAASSGGQFIRLLDTVVAEFLLSLSRNMVRREWEPVTRGRLLAFGAGLAVFFLILFRSEPGFMFLVDHANLLFHEAGHPAVGLFSTRLEPYGGTMGQLVFPIVLAVSFWRKGQALGVAAGCIWFFENWLNIARYMADARTLQLLLVGGGDHDWNTILFRWNLLQYDTTIAAVLRVVAWTGIAASCAWVGWRAWMDRGRSVEEGWNLGSLRSKSGV